MRKGEVYRKSDQRYVYCYTDLLGRRKYIYANDLVTLRDLEEEHKNNQKAGLNVLEAKKFTINDMFDRYMSMNTNLERTTQSNYFYMYDRFVRETFGKNKIVDVKFYDVKRFYNILLQEQEIKINTLEIIHYILHPTFQLAVQDNLIEKNPSDHVLAKFKRSKKYETGVRHALTIPQQKAFMEHIATHPVYYHWWPIFTILLGTGCRISEALGLRWEDIDFEKRVISINHTVIYAPVGKSRKCVQHISKPKTRAGERTIPMFDNVKDAFEMLREEQEGKGWDDVEIDGMRGFVFRTESGNVPLPQSVNRAIKRIVADYNAKEEVAAEKEQREVIMLPDFSAHNLRHTFCTRLCENEPNLKVIQSIMGHADITTTMNIYAEATEEKKQDSFKRLSSTFNNMF